MELALPHQLAVERLVELLPLAEVNWALTGSVAHRLQGANLKCRDVDIQADALGAYEIAARLATWVLEPVGLRVSAQIRSRFGRLRFEDLDVDLEVMGAVQKLPPAGSWTVPTDPSEHRVLVPSGPALVPVLSLAYEAEAYEWIGRLDRARLLRSLL